ncbi:MAG TPA: phosphoribosyltransferase [Anaerolineales bacterium]
MKSYAYAHRFGVKRITWDDFAVLSTSLAERLEPFHPQMILGIARAGLFPATALACSLRCELFPIRLTRRRNDEVVYNQPVWKVLVPQEVSGKIVAVVDEISDTGQTLAMAADQARLLGAAQVITASLVSHSWADPSPQITALVSDEFIIFPWDQKVLVRGKWIDHPEIVAGLKAQKKKPTS